MSQTQSRLIGAIRRIAREDPQVRSSLKASQNRGGKPGSVGLALDATEALEATEDRKGEVNKGTSSTDTSSPACGMQGEDPADFGAALAGLECVQDCETGEPVCFEGADFVPPDGWDDANTPPIVSGWDGETYYRLCLQKDGEKTSCSYFAEASKPWSKFLSKWTESCFIPPPDGEPEDSFFGCVGLSGSFRIFNCSSTYNAEFCDPDNPPLETEWPEDDCVNLAVKDGKIVGSKYDPENDGSYTKPRDEIELCDPESGERILIRPSANGGWRAINALDGDINPQAPSGYLYDKDGRRIRQIMISEFRDPFV